MADRDPGTGFYFYQIMSIALRNTIKQDAFWKINKRLVIELGIEQAVVLTEIIEKYFYYVDKRTSLFREDRNWFFYTSEDIKSTFGISYKIQKRILFELTHRGLIVSKLFLTPAKLHISICENTIENLLFSSFDKRSNLEIPKGEINIGQNGETIIKNIDNNSLSVDKETVSNLQEHFESLNATAIRKKVVPKKEKSIPVLMRNSPEFDIGTLKFKFMGTMYSNANLEFYYECALAWSDKDGKKAVDWYATIRNFILRDYKVGKMVTGVVNQEQKIDGIAQAIANWDDI